MYSFGPFLRGLLSEFAVGIVFIFSVSETVDEVVAVEVFADDVFADKVFVEFVFFVAGVWGILMIGTSSSQYLSISRSSK